MVKIEELTTKDELIRSLESLSIEEDEHLNQSFDKNFVKNECVKLTKRLKLHYWAYCILAFLVIALMLYLSLIENLNISDFIVIIIMVPLGVKGVFTLKRKIKIYNRLLEIS